MASGASAAAARHARDPNILSVARLLLAAVTLAAIYVNPTEPAHYARLVYGLLAAYVAYSAAVFQAGHRSPHGLTRYGVILHCVDVAVAAALTLFTEGVNSPFFAFFAFILLAAAWRWGFWPTIATAVTALVLLFVEALLASSLLRHSALQITAPNLNGLMVRGAYLILVSVIVGQLAEAEKNARVRLGAITDIVTSVQRGGRFIPSVETAAEQILQLFLSPRMVLVTSQTHGPSHVWDARRDAPGGRARLTSFVLDPAEREAHQLDVTFRSWVIRARGRGDTAFEIAGWRPGQDDVRVLPLALPRRFVLANPFRTIVGTSVTLSDEWSGQVVLFDPALELGGQALIALFEAVVNNVAPSLYNVYLAQRLRSRAQAMERARVARELHDGVIQALIALEMQVDALRRRRDAADAEHDELALIQQSLQTEIQNVRDLMQHLTLIDVAPSQLLDVMGNMVGEFEHRAGIRARFVASLDEISASAHVCREIVRVLQEALTNVRKHGRAHTVVVRMDTDSRGYRLTIDDDGCGFDFAGEMTMDELDAARRGPVILKERVRAIGGTLRITSTPGEGTRLEIVFPPRVRAT